MRHNGRPAMPTSSFTPNMLSLYAGEAPMVACPDCRRWRGLRRGMLAPHRLDDGVTRCPGSGQRIRIDLTPAEWQTRLREAERDAGRRQGTRVVRSPQPPTPPAVGQLAA